MQNIIKPNTKLPEENDDEKLPQPPASQPQVSATTPAYIPEKTSDTSQTKPPVTVVIPIDLPKTVFPSRQKTLTEKES